MFKLTFSAFATLFFVASAQANDSAVAKISVKGIDPGSLQENKEVKFYGGNADTFFQMLPGIKIAGTRDEQRKQNSKHRGLMVVSKGNTLYVNCTKVGSDADGNETKLAYGTECSISFAKGADEEGDSFELKPRVCK